MVFDFVFTKKELPKGEFFQWLIDTMVEKGWENLSSNKANVDHYTMFSTGEKGDEKIGVQLRHFYTSITYDFNTTVYGQISARPFHSYTASPSPSSVGTYLPNGEFVNIRILPNEVKADENIVVHYHINKDRVILAVENNNSSTTISAIFAVLGKPYTVADSDEYCKSAVIASQGNYACRSGVVGNNSNTLHVDSLFRVTNLAKGRVADKQFASEIVLYNDIDGDKFIVENVFSTNFDNSRLKTLTADMRKNTFKDSEGRVYKLFVNNYTSAINSNALRTFMIRIG